MNSSKTTKIFLDGTLILVVLNRHVDDAMDGLELDSECPLVWDLSVSGEARATTQQPIRVHMFKDGRVLVNEGCPDFDPIHGDWIGDGYQNEPLDYIAKKALDEHGTDEISEELYETLVTNSRELERLYA